MEETIQQMMEVIPAEHFYNYETNICDNPGQKEVIDSQVHCCVECKSEHSKQAVGVMFCGNAIGQ